MRRFETILAVAAALAVFWPVVFGSRPRRGIVAGTLVLVGLAQLQLEGFRWQMIPLYLAALSLAVGDVVFLDRRLGTSSRVIRGLLGVVGLAFASVLPVVFPVPELPVPTGPEAIGTITVPMIDRSRDEPYGDFAGGPRELVTQVWYPANGQVEERVPWSIDWREVTPAISQNLGLPSWFLGHTRYSPSHAGEDLPVSEGTFPVVVFSHNWESVRTSTIHQIESLVSNGYIVVAIDHPYLAAATVLGEGRVVNEDPAALPDPSLGQDEFDEAAMTMVDTMAGDIGSVLDALSEGEDGPFAAIASAADLDRIGIYGHGAGGGAAVKVCLVDTRCSAVLGLDPWVEPLTEADLRQTMTRPALYVLSDDWVGTLNDGLLRGIGARGEAITYIVTVEGANSNDFTVLPLLSPMGANFGFNGEISAGRVIPIVDNYLVGFFDVFLVGTGSAALDSVSFPEASVSVIQP